MLPTEPRAARWFLIAAGLTGASAVLLGAFGAHGLEGRLAPNLMRAYQKAVDYHFVHALLLLFVALAIDRRPSVWLNAAGSLALTGILLFCGSLYLLALTGVRGIGWITPLGGVAFVLAWLCLLRAAR